MSYGDNPMMMYNPMMMQMHMQQMAKTNGFSAPTPFGENKQNKQRNPGKNFKFYNRYCWTCGGCDHWGRKCSSKEKDILIIHRSKINKVEVLKIVLLTDSVGLVTIYI